MTITGWLMVLGAVLVLALGIWIGIGAPGWPHQPTYRRRHTDKRPLNPVQWGRQHHTSRSRRRR